MVYRKRKFIGPLRKNGRFKKRKSYRRGKRGPSMYKQYMYNMKKMQGLRKYVKENRDGTQSIDVPLDNIVWKAIAPLGCNPNHNTYVTAGDTVTLGITQQAAELGVGVGLDGTPSNTGKWMIEGEKCTSHFRNVSLHPLFLTICEVVCKRDLPFDSGFLTIESRVIEAFKCGVQNLMGNATDSTTLFGGDDIFTLSSANTLLSRSALAHPQMARSFNTHFKIVKKKKFKLNPGDDVFWKTSNRKHIYDTITEMNPADGTIGGADARVGIFARKGLGRCLMVRVAGVMGALTGDVTVQGLMGCHLTYDDVVSARVVPFKIGENNLSMLVQKDTDASIAALVGPTEHAELADK